MDRSTLASLRIFCVFLRRAICSMSGMKYGTARSQLFLIQHELKEEEIGALLRMQAQFSRISICLFPYGSFLLYGERAVPHFMPDIEQIARLKKTQKILRDARVDLSIIGLNDTLAALGEA